MKNIVKIMTLSFLSMGVSHLYAAPTANGDAVSQAYAMSKALSTQEHVPGVSLIGGQIVQSQALISGKLPYVMSYVGSVRNSLSSSNDYFDQFLTTGGWTDNYHNSIRFYSYNNSRTVGYYAIRLPGSRQDIWLRNIDRSVCSGGVQRAFSSDVLGNLAYDTGANVLWSCSTDGYQFTENTGGGITITYRGAIYKTTTYSVSQSGTTYYRIASVQQPQGDRLTFTYDSGLNMTKVADGRSNVLNFFRTYKAGTTQTTAEKRLITSVDLVSGSSGVTKQTATLTYGSYNSQDANGSSGIIYYPVTAVSTGASKVTFGYTPIKQWGIDGYLKYKNIAITNTNAATLTSVKDASNVVQRQWVVSQNYSGYNSNTKTYSTAKVTLRVYTPVGTSTAQDYTIDYDDNARTVTLNTKPDGVTSATVKYTITPRPVTRTSDTGVAYVDDSLSDISVTGSYPALTIGDHVPVSFSMNAWKGYITTAKSALGLTMRQGIDSTARLISSTETTVPARITNYTYGNLSNGAVNLYNIPSQVKTPLLTIVNTINTNGQITQQTQSSSQTGSTTKTTLYTYFTDTTKTNYGLLSSVDGPRSGTIDKISYTYDNYGNKATESQVVNSITRTTQFLGYNSFAKPERIVYANGTVEQFIYNADGTLKQKIYGTGGTTGTIVGQTTSYTYNALKQLVTETNADGEVTSYEYNSIGQVIAIKHPDGSFMRRTYHPNGAMATEKVMDSAGTSYLEQSQTLDQNGRILRKQNGTNTDWYWVDYSYDLNGNLTQTKSRLGITESWTYDVLNRVISHTDGAGNVDTKAYDAEDNVIKEYDALSSGSWPYAYRNGNVLTQESNTDYGFKSYSYDDGDVLTQSIYEVRQCNNSNIDALERRGRVTCVYKSGTTTGTLSHDFSYGYDTSRFGRLDKVTSNTTYGASTNYIYDNYDRITKKSQVNKAVLSWGGAQPTLDVYYEYTTGDKLSSLTLPSGRKLTYTYSSTKKNQLTDITLDNVSLLRSITYNTGGQMTGWNWGTGNAGYTWIYDVTKNGVIKKITNKNNSSAENYSLNYDFDRDGRIVKLTRNGGLVDTFTYTNADRLATETRVNGTTNVFSIAYTYDANGNRLSLAATGAHQQPYANVSYSYSRNRLVGINNGMRIIHTPNAELVYGGFTPQYDYAGNRRWTGKQNGTGAGYYMAYNYKNERTVRSIENNGKSWKDNAIQYVYDEASHLIGEYNASGTPIVEYVWLGDKPVAAIYGSGSSAKTYWIVSDAQNTPRRLIDSVSQAIVWSWDSTAFGVMPPSVETVKFNLRFPGQYYDELTKQHYNLNRYYNPELGRYMEPDPIGLEGGLNPYVYVGGNPVNNVDPSGLFYSNSSTNMTDVYSYNIENTISLDYITNHSMDFQARYQSDLVLNQISTQNAQARYNRNMNASVANMVTPGFMTNDVPWTPLWSYKRSVPTSRQDLAEGLQTVGTVADVAAIACAASVVCSPISPAIGGFGFVAGTAGTVLDNSQSNRQKVISTIVPLGAGRVAKSVAKNTPYVNGVVADAYGLYVDKTAGFTIDAAYSCRKNPNQHGC